MKIESPLAVFSTCLRHAAALALVGWYLASPPITPGRGVDITAPISQWDQGHDFYSATDCDEARAGQIDLAKTLAAQIQERLESVKREVESLSDEEPARMGPELNRKLAEATPRVQQTLNLLASMRASKCIASDDPRLAK
jgi:hypothetical protein